MYVSIGLRVCVLVCACEFSTRAYSPHTGPGNGRVLDVWCCTAASCLPWRGVRSEILLELVRRILRGCAYTTAFGICNPSGAPLYVYARMCTWTTVVVCSPSGVPIVMGTCMIACTAFGMYGPSDVLVA